MIDEYPENCVMCKNFIFTKNRAYWEGICCHVRWTGDCPQLNYNDKQTKLCSMLKDLGCDENVYSNIIQREMNLNFGNDEESDEILDEFISDFNNEDIEEIFQKYRNRYMSIFKNIENMRILETQRPFKDYTWDMYQIDQMEN